MSKSTRTCSFDGCGNQVRTKGLCSGHYQQQRNGQDLRPLRPRTVEGRLWAKVNKNAPGGCWEWAAATAGGYGLIGINGTCAYAHRLSWELANGPVPYGMVVDHECHNKSCVNPAHLRLATTKQNAEYRQGAQRNNRNSGVRGVYKAGKSWRVMVRHNQELHHFGCYPTVAEAEAVAIRERARLFTFPEYTC